MSKNLEQIIREKSEQKLLDNEHISLVNFV